MIILNRKTLIASAALSAAIGFAATSAPSQAAKLTPYVTTYHHHHAPGIIAAGVVGGLALGALAASAGPVTIADGYDGDCYVVRRRYVDLDGYPVVRRIRVCD